MRINKKHIPPIRLIRKRHLLPQLPPLPLPHPLQSPPIPPIQRIINQPQAQHNKTQRRQRRHDTDLPTDIPRRLLILESLRAEDIADGKGDDGHRVRGHFLAVARDVGRVPGEEQHEGCAEGAGEETRAEEAGFVRRHAVRVQTDHEAGGEDGGEDGEEHHEGAVVPFVGEVAD